jgi:hypothetical protein
MNLTSLLSSGLIAAVVAVFLIARQFVPRSINPLWMLGVPLVAGFLGVQALAGSPPAGGTALALLAVNLGLGAGAGLLRGVTVRIWQDPARGWMMQGTALTFVLWLVTIGLKVGFGIADRGAFSTSEIGLLVAVTFGAQNLAVWARMAGLLPGRAYDRAG